MRCILLQLVAHLFKASYEWPDMFRFEGNSVEDVLSAWAVFTWSTKQWYAMCCASVHVWIHVMVG